MTHPVQSAEMLRQILIESSLKQENEQVNRTELDGPVGEVSAPDRMRSYSWDSVIDDRMLSAAAQMVHRGVLRQHDSMLAGSSADSDGEVAAAHELDLSPNDYEEDVTEETDQSEMLGLNIDNDSSGDYLLACLLYTSDAADE